VKQISIIIAAGALVCGAAFAQNDSGVAEKLRAEAVAGGGLGPITVARFGMIGPTVKGAPYSADGVTESTQTLGDGTHISRQETYKIYRDGEGRVRRESGDQVWISDPVANVSYVLDTKHQTARKLGLARTIASGKMALDQANKVRAEQMAGGPIWFSTSGNSVRIVTGGKMGAVGGEIAAPKVEPLGKQEMEGVEVEGTRTTTVIPQGQIGNDRPLQIVHERWESPELQVTIMSKHTDPMAGDFTERLTNVLRGEPDPALFQVPAGYTVESVESDQR